MNSQHTVSFTNITQNKWSQSAATYPLDLVDQRLPCVNVAYIDVLKGAHVICEWRLNKIDRQESHGAVEK